MIEIKALNNKELNNCKKKIDTIISIKLRKHQGYQEIIIIPNQENKKEDIPHNYQMDCVSATLLIKDELKFIFPVVKTI